MIDVIVSDHDPQDVETKRLPFAEAAPGAIGLETMLTAGLRLVGAQPSVRGPEVECAIPPGTAARLELFDLLGRRVWSRDLGALGAGTHRVRAGEGLALAPGMYAVRFVRGEQSSTVRAIVVR